ncbi:MAG: hypothetical protein Q9187_003863 [Circinaria calcarea]
MAEDSQTSSGMDVDKPADTPATQAIAKDSKPLGNMDIDKPTDTSIQATDEVVLGGTSASEDATAMAEASDTQDPLRIPAC